MAQDFKHLSEESQNERQGTLERLANLAEILQSDVYAKEGLPMPGVYFPLERFVVCCASLNLVARRRAD